jgi:hypothetical protein
VILIDGEYGYLSKDEERSERASAVRAILSKSLRSRLLRDISPYLSLYVRSVPIQSAVLILKQLVPVIVSHDDPTLQTSLIDAICNVLSSASVETTQGLRQLCMDSLMKLVGKPLEGSVIRSLLSLLLCIVKLEPTYLSVVLCAIASAVRKRPGHSQDGQLPLLSNEIIDVTREKWYGEEEDEDDDGSEEENWDDDDDETTADSLLKEFKKFLNSLDSELSFKQKNTNIVPSNDWAMIVWIMNK